MKFLRFLTIICLTLAAVSLVSCKDDDDDSSTRVYLSGNITFTFPAYVQYGDVIHVAPTGAYKGDDPADSLLAYSWTDPITGITDTLRLEGEPAGKSKEFDFVVSKDSLDNFTLTVTAWAEGYYTKTTSVAFTVVNPTLGTGSLKGYDFLPSAKTFTDARDGRQYYYNMLRAKTG